MSAGVVAVGVLLLGGLLRGSLRVTAGEAVALRVEGPARSGPWSVAGALARWWDGLPARRVNQLERTLPEALDGVARALRSGASLPGALAEAGGQPGAAGAAFAGVVAAGDRGVPLRDALAAWAGRDQQPAVRLTATALGLASEAGGAAAGLVESVAATLRERRALAAEVAVQSAQARLSAVVIGLLPLGFAAWCVATDDRAAGFLLGSPAGWLCLVAGLALLGLGAWWMGRILRSAR